MVSKKFISSALLVLIFSSVAFCQTDTSELFITRTLSHDTIYFEGADAYGSYNTRSTVTLHGYASNGTLFFGQKYDIIFVTDNGGSMGGRQAGDRDWTDTCSRIQAAYNACANFIDSFGNPGMRIGHMYFSAVVGTSCLLGSDLNLVKARIDTFVNGSAMVNGTVYNGTALYTGIHNAVRYVAANYRKSEGAIPIVIALTDGDDNASGEWGTVHCYSGYGYCWPALQPNLGPVEIAAVDSVIRVIDSVRNAGVNLKVYTINLGLQDVNNYLHNIAAAGNGQWAYSNSGADLSPIFQSFWADIVDVIAKKINSSTPMVVDVLGPDIHFVPGSYGANTAAGYIVPANFSVTNVGGYQVLNFSIDTVKLGQFFEIHYDISAARTTLSGGPTERKRVNNAASDDAINYSKMQYINMVGQTILTPIGRAYIYVRSLNDGIFISTSPSAFTDPGQIIHLSYNLADTAKYGPVIFYPLLLQRGTGITQYAQIAATWNFSPISGWVANPPGGITNSISSFQFLGLSIAGNNALAGQRTLSISYNDGSATFRDSIIFNAMYIAVDESVTVAGITRQAAPQITSTSQFLTTYTIMGNYNQLATLPCSFYSTGSTNFLNFWAIDAQWSASGFSTYDFTSILSGSSNSKAILLSNAQLPARTNTPVNDTGIITITYTPSAPAGQVKTGSFNLIIRDTTDYDTADVIVINQYADYINQVNKDILYNRPGLVVSPSAQDTVKLVGLIFDINVSGPHFVGNAEVPFNATQLTWYVNGVIRSSTGGADPVLQLTNEPGEKDTVVAVYNSIRDTMIVSWGLGVHRYLHIETAPAILNTNTPILDIEAITLPVNMQSDTLYAVIRDDFGYAVANDPIERWSFTDIAAYTYLTVPLYDVSTNECVIIKTSTPSGLWPTYLLVATLNAQPIAGVNASTQYDTVAITLPPYSFITNTIYADSSNDFQSLYETGIYNTKGTQYRQEPIQSNDTIVLGALRDTVVLRVKQASNLNPGHDAYSLSVQWIASDYSWCEETAFSQSATIALKPINYVANVICLIARFDTSGLGIAPLLDTVFFKIDSGNIAIENPPWNALPAMFLLSDPTPNPFNPTATLNYAVPTQAPVFLTIFNVRGEIVFRLVGRMHEPGYYQAIWDGKDALGRGVQSGLYVCRMEAGSVVQQRKMIMVK
ncbi:MAG: hypothetical protein A2268_08670 [Candidatus Raymondbacteria bacterium RifOxyA12_full_50_37]|uniref:VWFA domain-containing protein n=1 Tax=Candidatus Raymondbacteria bacterium RIFOXYD12_FULL_49_13 TaxID=1817890 RepID=A0A1F7EZW7_UNCRA|nr:MAG: hypothetical protein A2268_08670 [Candidatus Raymondbacteria bacterium RifOxyA12_full_50_37]OGJ92685.1 MAG: hypothetical protein A2248_07695 [Candidatus Raymondbacteria bacterium RIFOXYA2_FULL_49_16]OGJ93087.1 MAG: hypothetical protein A2487_10190 [Candidatus Raymondbacteria bacterium RifOxyC12_full_50_8]OGJ96538.1 MAG: hypothetical protein A2350_02875 [Candidatus Raymondbacteria bacterium RifOxyB12_full_50_8]OGJ99030.1 MAG: hypothetical protein A2453_06095 [Candidatus Raymondbacteria b